MNDFKLINNKTSNAAEEVGAIFFWKILCKWYDIDFNGNDTATYRDAY